MENLLGLFMGKLFVPLPITNLSQITKQLKSHYFWESINNFNMPKWSLNKMTKNVACNFSESRLLLSLLQWRLKLWCLWNKKNIKKLWPCFTPNYVQSQKVVFSMENSKVFITLKVCPFLFFPQNVSILLWLPRMALLSHYLFILLNRNFPCFYPAYAFISSGSWLLQA